MNLHYWNKNNLQYNKIGFLLVIKIIIVIISLITVPSIVFYRHGFNDGKESEITEKDIILVYQEAEKNGFTKRKFLGFLKEINIKYPELVFAQAIKECGFKSNIWVNNNNPFGMKEANKRPNKQNGSQFGHAYYNTWKDAVIDYAMYQSYIGLSKVKTEDEYLNFLKQMNYYDVNHPNNVTYLSDLKSIRNNIDRYLD